MSAPLVLSLFPGIGLLDMAFEAEGFCVVRGPDLLWGGDVRRFHPPVGKFDGIIGGPPCKQFSPLANVARHRWGTDSVSPDMIPEFVRVVSEAEPHWWVSENVREAPVIDVQGYVTTSRLVNALDVGAVQHRIRRFCFGTARGAALPLETIIFRPAAQYQTVTGQGRKRYNAEKDRLEYDGASVDDMCEAQGLPRDFFAQIAVALKLHGTDVLTKRGKQLVIGNGVPIPMGRAIARAVKAAMYPQMAEGAA